ncbi:hypothetical protein QYE76_026778 [Lolium multiflorum]|uniref:CCHC-type domain-containing protein n=1 Tax=Lolium multiflorum TaxID=4521 RepID=A0AAD8VX93_LOLMU|nr:hypothetical protein QYE76_026778 [Lolium multiflorum]
MANRGGGQPNRGRPQGGHGGAGWQDGFGAGRGSNYFQGGPSGTAGSGADAGDQSSVFGDGVFRAGSVRPNNGGDRGDRRYNHGFNNQHDGRRNYGYNNYNSRRYVPNNSAAARSTNGGYAATVPVLSEFQQKLVTEAAEALAKQLAGRPEFHNSEQHMENRNSQPVPNLVRQTGSARFQPVQSAPNTVTQAPRPEEVMLAVAGIGSKDSVTHVEGMSEADFVAANTKKGPSCFRCRQHGHFLNDCEVILCDCCQKPDHATKDCPLHKAPRPRLAMYGMGHPDLAFWELPLSSSVRPRVENTRLGRVEVSGGTLSIAQLITHLQWVVPDSAYQWEVEEVEEHVFKVNFPSKVELVRVQHFGRFHVPDSSIILSFDFWKKDVEPVWAPEDVWVRVYGLPPVALDDYLSLWALGDVFGKTKEVDIAFTRKYNVLRMFITCLDTALIPDNWDLKIKNEFFRLRFEVEGGKHVVPSDVTMSEAPGEGGDDDPHAPNNQKKDELDRNTKRTKNVGENEANKSGASSSPQLNDNAVGKNDLVWSHPQANSEKDGRERWCEGRRCDGRCVDYLHHAERACGSLIEAYRGRPGSLGVRRPFRGRS